MNGPLYAVVGPTGTGKSELALSVAERIDGEIVSVDSAQVFRGLDVGTAKPTEEERARVPHHVLDTVEPEEQWSAADYQAAADAAIGDIRGRSRAPILCGGTGLWMRALVRGIFRAPEIAPEVRERVRRELRERGPEALHRELVAVDPSAARRIASNDPQRIGRALEVYRQTGTPISELQERHGFAEKRYDLIGVALDWPRDELRTRLAARAERMYRGGLVEEAESCLARGVPEDAPGLSIIGYRDAVRFLRGRCTREEALAATITATRQYAKRQRNWFNHEPEVSWLPHTVSVEEVVRILSHRSGGQSGSREPA